MGTIDELIQQLKIDGIDVLLKGENLEVRFDGDRLDPEARNLLKANKQQIVAHLQKRAQQRRSFQSIPVLSEQSSYEVSPSQLLIWLMCQFEQAAAAYQIPSVHIFEGELKVEAFQKALGALLERHEILRTVFLRDEQGRIRQSIQPIDQLGFEWHQQDLRGLASAEEELQRQIEQFSTELLDLKNGPLLRIALLQVEDQKWVFNFVIHHIICDAWSISLLIRDLFVLYDAFSVGRPNPLSPLHIQYKDYADWLQKGLLSDRLSAHRQYWHKQFEGEIPLLELPTRSLRPAHKTYHGRCLSQTIQNTIQLQAICQQRGATLFMGLLALVKTLLYKYSHQEDLIVGTVIAGREHADLAEQVGCYLNTLPLRTQFSAAESFVDLLDKVKLTALDAHKHQEYPFDQLIRELDLKKDPSRSPLFDVLVTLQNAQMATDPNRPQQMNGLSIRSLGQDNVRHSKFDISFIFEPCGNDVVLHLEYNTDLYDEPMARHLVQHLQQLLDSILADKQASLTSLDYIDSAEKHKLLHEFNATDVDFPSFLHLSELFAQQVEKTPDAIALIFEGQEWTYRQLDDASNRLAHFLVEHHQIQAGDWIGLTLDRTERLIVAILAIVKVGACYVPIDNQYPQDRIEYVLQDSECKLLLDENFFADFTTLEAKLSTKPIETTPELDGLYCCIYTSGSTGNPKGVLIPHAQVISRLQWAWKEFPYQSGEVASLRTTVSFVDHIGELWAPILAGIPSVLFGRNIQLDADAFRRALGAYKVSRITLVPTLLKELLKDEDSCREQLAQSKVWMISGEELQTELVARFYQILPRQKLINLYGATEITDATFFDTSQLCTTDELELEPAARYQRLLTKGRMPLGQPISNAQVYVLDKLQALVATEVVGEICVSGVTLNRGYWKKPELDAQKFVAHPFKAGEQLYRTGDLGRWRADGRLEYLGRMDYQVKIRGHRIELGEIENTLMRFPSVLQVVVRPWEDGPHQGQLVAYLRSAEKMELATLRQSLKSQLPSYMLPTHFVFLDEFPLSPNGKIDKKRLSLLGQSQIVRTPYVAARNELEQSLVDIWQEVLGVKRIGIKEDFMEVGGHSLQVVQVLARIQNAMGIQLEIRHLYEGSTIEQLAEVIEFIRQQESLKYESEALLKIEI